MENEEKELEWKLWMRPILGSLFPEIRHNKCNYFVYDVYYGSTDKNLEFCCINCKKKAPDHYILQWKILAGK